MRKMNKGDLVSAVSEKTGLTKKDSDQAITATFEVIENELKNGGKISLIGFGSFEVKNREARIGRNPYPMSTGILYKLLKAA
jgi:DNA-binding protein HU-beta